MRPIDADKLVSVLADDCKGYELSDILSESYVKDVIDDIPTLEVTPVVHAHWIPECPNKRTGKAYSHTCSRCGRTVYDERQVSIDELGYTFCPHCGARMDEDNE